MTAEELELAAAIREARAKENALERSRKHRTRKRTEDLKGYQAKVTEQKKQWADNNPNKVLKIAAKVRNKAKDDKRFYCEDCEMALASQSALDKHNNTTEHMKRVVGIENSAPSRSAVSVAAIRKEAVANKTHYCSTCDKAFINDWSLQRHLATSLHAKRLAKAEKKSLLTPTNEQSYYR